MFRSLYAARSRSRETRGSSTIIDVFWFADGICFSGTLVCCMHSVQIRRKQRWDDQDIYNSMTFLIFRQDLLQLSRV